MIGAGAFALYCSLAIVNGIFGLAITGVVVICLLVPRLARFDRDVPDAPPDDVVGAEAHRARHEAGARPSTPAVRDVAPV